MRTGAAERDARAPNPRVCAALAAPHRLGPARMQCADYNASFLRPRGAVAAPRTAAPREIPHALARTHPHPRRARRARPRPAAAASTSGQQRADDRVIWWQARPRQSAPPRQGLSTKDAQAGRFINGAPAPRRGGAGRGGGGVGLHALTGCANPGGALGGRQQALACPRAHPHPCKSHPSRRVCHRVCGLHAHGPHHRRRQRARHPAGGGASGTQPLCAALRHPTASFHPPGCLAGPGRCSVGFWMALS